VQTAKKISLIALAAFTLQCSTAEAGSSSGVLTVSPGYAIDIAGKVDSLVSKDFFDQNVRTTTWSDAYKEVQNKLAQRKAALTMAELSTILNRALQSLKTSHCQFVSQNDESFYFLHSLFATINPAFRHGQNSWAHPIACTGLATGGCGYAAEQVRYVLDGSPAAKAGLVIGDYIKQVDGRPYTGYLNFLGKEGRQLTLEIERASSGKKQLTITPVKKDLYQLYVDATRASKEKIKVAGRTIGYIHLWAGGSASAEAVSDILTTDLKDVDGLVYDLRDGYGGASLNDLDLFYRPAAAYPDCLSKKDGKTNIDRMYFDKPMVVLINSGSRSGKELLAFSLKNAGRALLVGENTAGAVVAGRLYPLDGKCALYLAVADISLQVKKAKSSVQERLEGQGVAPDLVVLNKTKDDSGYGLQLKSAIEALEKRLSDQN